MLDWVFRRVKGKKKTAKKRKKKPSYEEAKRIAASNDSAARAELAEHEELEPEFLYFFATDKDAKVRKAVAQNEGSPLQADLLLAKDIDPLVREELAFKIGRLIPTLTEEESERLVDMTFEVLEILAKDQLPKIRAIVAEEIKHLDNVPKRMIHQLAQDAEATVAGPILEYSPLLTDEQLLQLITSGLRGGALEAIARRHGIPTDVSQAVFDSNEDPALAALLDNKTANISDKLMDEIAIHVEDKPDLHGHLVDRGSLSPNTLKRISTFVSAALLERLLNVNGVKKETAHEIRMAVRGRIEHGDKKPGEELTGEALADHFHKLGKLNDDAILDAIDDGDEDFLKRAITIMAKLSKAQVNTMLGGGSAKAICALAWKAGLSASTAVSIQRKVAKIPTKSMIKEAVGGNYAMNEDELTWYIDYFAK